MGEVNEGIPIWHGNECLMKMGSEEAAGNGPPKRGRQGTEDAAQKMQNSPRTVLQHSCRPQGSQTSKQSMGESHGTIASADYFQQIKAGEDLRRNEILVAELRGKLGECTNIAGGNSGEELLAM